MSMDPIWTATLVTGAAGGLVAIWAIWYGRVLKRRLFPTKPVGDTTAEQADGAMDAADILKVAQDWLSAHPSPFGIEANRSIDRLRASPKVVEQIDQLIATAFATDDATSLLERADDDYTYVVVVPDRFESARAIGRYGGFANGWRENLRAIRAEVAGQNTAAQVTALLLLLDPDRGDSALILSRAEHDRLVSPRTLDTSPCRNADLVVPDSDALVEFRLAA